MEWLSQELEVAAASGGMFSKTVKAGQAWNAALKDIYFLVNIFL
jgi:hypothetical protein